MSFTPTKVTTMMMNRRSVGIVWTLCQLLAVAQADEKFVTCGSAVKLTHVESSPPGKKTQYYLQSENKNLGSGSGQQIVTCTPEASTNNALWWIREANDEPVCAPGTPIACNTIIRLTHLDTMKNLHTHGIPSPLSRQQEISAFGAGDGKGDGGDNWMVMCDSPTKTHWKRGERVRFLHQDTGKYLGASSTVKFDVNNCGHQCPILNHLEAFGRKGGQDDYTFWKVDMGVHLSK